MTERIRELSFEERARWGECPVCGAKDGEACNGPIGTPGAVWVGPHVHVGRLRKSPRKVKEVPCE